MNRIDSSSIPVDSQYNPSHIPASDSQNERIEAISSQILAPTPNVEYLAKIATLESKIFTHQNFSRFYEEIKANDIYKLVFMERCHLVNGKFAYEAEEPGYLAAILNGFHYMLDTLDQELTPELYEKLHDQSVGGLTTQEEPDGVPTGFRKITDGNEAFGLVLGETLSKRGYNEFLNRFNTYHYVDEQGDKVYFLKQAVQNPIYTITTQPRPQNLLKKAQASSSQADYPFQANPSIVLNATRPETCKADVAAIIKMYQDAPKGSPKEILAAVGTLCQDMDQRHVFVDGNIRTTGIQLLNRELLRNGQAPCAMLDVNQLDCLHLTKIEEDEGPGVVEQIIEGQNFVKTLKSLPE